MSQRAIVLGRVQSTGPKVPEGDLTGRTIGNVTVTGALKAVRGELGGEVVWHGVTPEGQNVYGNRMSIFRRALGA